MLSDNIFISLLQDKCTRMLRQCVLIIGLKLKMDEGLKCKLFFMTQKKRMREAMFYYLNSYNNKKHNLY